MSEISSVVGSSIWPNEMQQLLDIELGRHFPCWESFSDCLTKASPWQAGLVRNLITQTHPSFKESSFMFPPYDKDRELLKAGRIRKDERPTICGVLLRCVLICVTDILFSFSINSICV